jgi:hypothetical protein
MLLNKNTGPKLKTTMYVVQQHRGEMWDQNVLKMLDTKCTQNVGPKCAQNVGH